MHHVLTLACSLAIMGAIFVDAARAADEQDSATIAAPRDVGWKKRHESFNKRAQQGDVDLLFLGDSITQGWANMPAWKKYYGDRKAFNEGIGGDRTQHVLWRIENGNVDGLSPKLIVLMIGTNNVSHNKPEDIGDGIKAIVSRLREKLPQTKILLLGVFPRAEKPADAARSSIQKVNEIAKTAADDQNVFFLDIGEKFLEPDGTISKEIMYDFLHLTPQGYEVWASAMEPKVAELLGDTPNK